MNEKRSSTRNLLVGYVMAFRPVDATSQEERIRELCDELGYKLAYVEKEPGSSHPLLRFGLWRAIRKLVCYKCDPSESRPASKDIAAWLEQSLAPCKCAHPESLDGLILWHESTLSTNPAEAKAFATSLAELHKHLIIGTTGKCISCCNESSN